MKRLRDEKVQDCDTEHDFPIRSGFMERLEAMHLPLCRLSCPFHSRVESSYLTPHSAFNWHPICIAENRGGGQTGRCVCGG